MAFSFCSSCRMWGRHLVSPKLCATFQTRRLLSFLLWTQNKFLLLFLPLPSFKNIEGACFHMFTLWCLPQEGNLPNYPNYYRMLSSSMECKSIFCLYEFQLYHNLLLHDCFVTILKPFNNLPNKSGCTWQGYLLMFSSFCFNSSPSISTNIRKNRSFSILLLLEKMCCFTLETRHCVPWLWTYTKKNLERGSM